MTMNASEIHAEVEVLPTLPEVMAIDMLRAQGWRPSQQERAAIKARADFFQKMGLDRSVNIRVVDVYTGVKIGTLVYNA